MPVVLGTDNDRGRIAAALGSDNQGLVVIGGCRGNELDPSSPELGVTAKMGIDATKPLGREGRFEKARVPGAGQLRIGHYLA